MVVNNKIFFEIPKLMATETLPIAIGTKELKNMMGYSDFDRFSFLYDSYADKVLGFIINHNYSKAEGEKVLVKVFITVWDNIKAYDDEEKKKLFRILAIAAQLIYKHKQITYSMKTQNMPEHAPIV